MRVAFVAVVLAVVTLLTPARASASLSTFQTFVGHVGLSTDGYGSNGSPTGTISAEVPAGATVLAAYLYAATLDGGVGLGASLNGSAVTFGAIVDNPTIACCGIGSARADVTAIVSGLVAGGPGGVYNFSLVESSPLFQDGEALVVVYSLASLPVSTVGILDGFSSVGGDIATVNFSAPVAPSDPGFFAEMRLGIGFSCNEVSLGCIDQTSSVTVNGTLISDNAGDFDDSGVPADGSLITVGGFDDPFSPMLPSVGQDHERYNLVPQMVDGETVLTVVTNNKSQDDNIFLATFLLKGEASITPAAAVPEPATLTLSVLGLAAAGWRRRRRAR